MRAAQVVQQCESFVARGRVSLVVEIEQNDIERAALERLADLARRSHARDGHPLAFEQQLESHERRFIILGNEHPHRAASLWHGSMFARSRSRNWDACPARVPLQGRATSTRHLNTLRRRGMCCATEAGREARTAWMSNAYGRGGCRVSWRSVAVPSSSSR